MNKLKMADNLLLPLDAVTQKIAFIGRTGSGKTYAATKLAELFGEAGAQFVVLDPVGKWWSLRLGANGKPSGLDVPVFGGLYGDLPLEPLMGARIADLIVDRQISAVLDVSQFEHNTDKARFAEAFATRLFFRKKSAPSAIHLFVEEAQEFCPQNPQGEEKRMLGAFERLIKLGRNFGIGASLISQRPQEINKKALNQTECLFVFQTTGTHERRAIDAWIADKGIDEDIAALLPSLHVGEARVWSPAWLRVSLTTTISAKRTFDASATPKVGARRVEVKALTPVDIAEITKSLADVVEKAKADDPRELKRRIAELEKQLKAAPSAPAKPVEVPLLTKEQEKHLLNLRDEVTGLRSAVGKLDQKFEALGNLYADHRRDVMEMAARVHTVIDRIPRAPQTVPRVAPHPHTNGAHRPVTAPKPAANKPVVKGADGEELTKGQATVLQVVVQLGEVDKSELTTLTGYKRSTRNRLIQELHALGCIHTQGEKVTPTDEGRRRSPTEELPTGDALLQWYLTNKLSEGQGKMLQAIAAVHPGEVVRDDLDEATGYKRSTRNRLLQELSAARLITSNGKNGPVRASDRLFD